MNVHDEEERKKYEQTFHNKLVKKPTKERFTPYDDQLLGPLEKEADDFLGDLKGKELLFYGCGIDWSTANKFYISGCPVTMIDISDESIEILQRKIQEMHQEGGIVPLQMDCEELQFESARFDLVFGRAILHHLDMEKALKEIRRVLKPGGKAVFIEPLGLNPFINLYRKLTPHLRTPFEHPLVKEDFVISKKIFDDVTYKEFTFLTFFGIGLNFLCAKFGLQPFSLKKFQEIDLSLLKRFPFLGMYYWNVVLCLRKKE